MADKECKNCKYVLTSNYYVPFVCSRTGTPTSDAWRCDLFEPTTQTNGDRIRRMSDYEMADWIADILNHCDNKTPEEECLESCPLYACCNLPFDNIENWLKSPAEKDGAP